MLRLHSRDSASQSIPSWNQIIVWLRVPPSARIPSLSFCLHSHFGFAGDPALNQFAHNSQLLHLILNADSPVGVMHPDRVRDLNFYARIPAFRASFSIGEEPLWKFPRRDVGDPSGRIEGPLLRRRGISLQLLVQYLN